MKLLDHRLGRRDALKLGVRRSGAPCAVGSQEHPPYLPEGAAIVGANLPGTTIEFNSDGSAEAPGGFTPTFPEPNPTIKVGSGGGNPQHRANVVRTTSRINRD